MSSFPAPRTILGTSMRTEAVEPLAAGCQSQLRREDADCLDGELLSEVVALLEHRSLRQGGPGPRALPLLIAESRGLRGAAEGAADAPSLEARAAQHLPPEGQPLGGTHARGREAPPELGDCGCPIFATAAKPRSKEIAAAR